MNISAFNPSKNILMLVFLNLFFLNITANAENTNTASEKRWAEQLRDNIVIGQPQDLPLSDASGADANSGDSTFFSIYTPHTTEKSKGAIVLLHGSGAHPDWNDVIHPLRAELPDKGWATLSIQLPLTFPDKNDMENQKQVIEASVARIDTAINYLRSQSYQHITLIAHSFGSLMALNFLQQKVDATTKDGLPLVSAAILIGTPSEGTATPLNSPGMIEKIKIPLLDLYGSKDHQQIIRMAKARKSAAYKAGNKQFRQTEIIGANHFFQGLEEELVRYCYHWLNKAIKKS